MKRPLVFPKSGDSDPELQKLGEFYEETLGFCPNSIKTMHHRPQIAYAFIEMNKAVMQNNGKVTSALKIMMAYISSNTAGCRYCQAHAIRAAERYGAEQEKLENNFSPPPILPIQTPVMNCFRQMMRLNIDFAFQIGNGSRNF